MLPYNIKFCFLRSLVVGLFPFVWITGLSGQATATVSPSENAAYLSELPVPGTDTDTSVNFALRIMRSNWLDSAITFVDHYLEKLPDATAIASDPVSLRLRVIKAEALERDEQNDFAISMGIELAADATAAGDWLVLAQTQLVFARVYEKLGMPFETSAALDESFRLINEYKLTSVTPQYHVRKSSFLRVMLAKKDSAILQAQIALKIATALGETFHLAEANLLLGMLTVEEDKDHGIAYFVESAKHYAAAGDIGSSVAMLENLASIHLRAGNPQLALTYSDSVLLLMNTAKGLGDEMKWFHGESMLNRSESLAALGRFEEALQLQEEAYRQKITYLEIQNRAEVANITAKYKNDQQKTRIEEQELLLAAGQKNRRILSFAIIAALMLSSIIALLYFRGKRKNRKIFSAYQQEIALRGEVHHRVKNNLQIIIGLLEMQSDEISDPVSKHQFLKLKERIYSMSVLHELLYQGGNVGELSLRTYSDRLLSHLQNLAAESVNLKYELEMPGQTFSLGTLVPLGLIIHELVTNSLKHGVGDDGTVNVLLRLQPHLKGWKLQYQDDGPGFPETELIARSGSLGTFLLTTMSRQLDGTLRTCNDDGAVVELLFADTI